MDREGLIALGNPDTQQTTGLNQTGYKKTYLCYAGLLHIVLGVALLHTDNNIQPHTQTNQPIPVILVHPSAKPQYNSHHLAPVVPVKSIPIVQPRRTVQPSPPQTVQVQNKPTPQQRIKPSLVTRPSAQTVPKNTTLTPKKTTSIQYKPATNQAISTTGTPQDIQTSTLTAPTNQPGPIVNTAEPGVQQASQTAYIQQLHRLLEQHKRYPRLARRRGEQGTVQVSFNIQADGSLHEIQLHTRSSSSRLNTAALQTVHRLNGHLPPLPTVLGTSPWPVKVPIVYALQ